MLWKLYGNSLQHTRAESSYVRKRIAARIEFFEASSYRSIYPSLAVRFIPQERASEVGPRLHKNSHHTRLLPSPFRLFHRSRQPPPPPPQHKLYGESGTQCLRERERNPDRDPRNLRDGDGRESERESERVARSRNKYSGHLREFGTEAPEARKRAKTESPRRFP